jgi:hypothetical protein
VGVYIKDSHHALTVITVNTDPSLLTQGWVGHKTCLVTVDTVAYVSVVRSDIVVDLPEKKPKQRFKLQLVPGEVLPVLRKVFLNLIMKRRPLKISAFVANITNKLILVLGILRAYDASVDLGRQSLRLAEEEVSLRSSGAGSRTSSLLVAKDQVIPAKCEGMLMGRLESPLGVGSDLLEQSP